VIDAKLNLYPAQTALVQYDLGRKVALVNLYRALGGGWKMSDTDWMKSAAGTPTSGAPSPTANP
jgi:multidrug efflux system outer membrane protein